MQKLTFRSTKIVYYGPFACQGCGATIVRMGQEHGGNAFDQPDGPIYPNTEWHVHVCAAQKGDGATSAQINTTRLDGEWLPQSPEELELRNLLRDVRDERCSIPDGVGRLSKLLRAE
jgi:hypothetical protein